MNHISVMWTSGFSGRLISETADLLVERPHSSRDAKKLTARKFSSAQTSWSKLIIGGQSLAIAALALWLYVEYLHNPFMREYVSNVWATIWPETTVALSGIIIGGVALTVYQRKHNRSVADARGVKVSTGGMEKSGDLASLDSCPFCNIPLKHLSGNRFQCRQCRRYYKSNVPTIEA